jgi:hypothetical protein
MSIDSMLNPVNSTAETSETPSGDGSGSSVSEKDTTKLANYLETKPDHTIADTGISNSRKSNTEYPHDLKRIFANVKHENPELFKPQAGTTPITESLIQNIRSLHKSYVG